MGRGSAYYVGLHLKQAGYEDAARFYFTTGAKLYEAPFNRLCRTALYETGTPAERLQSVQQRLQEIAEPASDKERQEKKELGRRELRLLLQTGTYQNLELASEYLYTAELNAELIQAFPQLKSGMPSFYQTITEGRIRVFEKRYAEAWRLIQTAFAMKYKLKELTVPTVLSDIGKAGVYGAEDKAAAAQFFERLAQQAAAQEHTESELSRENKRLLLFYTLFYAARCRARAGSGHAEQAVRLFEQAVDTADNDENFDSALWYYLDTLRTISMPRFLQAVARTAPLWKNAAWYRDLTEDARVRLTAARNWKSLEILYAALSKTDLSEQYAATAYTLSRSGYLPQQKAHALLQEISGSSHSPFYYRILAAHHLKAHRFSFRIRKPPSAKKSNIEFPAQEAEPYIDGLLHFGLYTRVYPEIATIYPAIPAEKAAAVSALLESKGRYADSIRITALALQNQEAAETEEQLHRLYPRPWQSIVERYAAEYRLPPYLLYALIRSESFFQPEIVSHAGAVGLTQLMPSTAADIAKKMKLPTYTLTDPETNIRFGAYYLAEMIRRSDNRIIPACCAYNAGISRVRSWQRTIGKLPEDIFLESLEYAETRGYGRKILTAAVMYGSLYYGEKPEQIVRYFFNTLANN